MFAIPSANVVFLQKKTIVSVKKNKNKKLIISDDIAILVADKVLKFEIAFE